MLCAAEDAVYREGDIGEWKTALHQGQVCMYALPSFWIGNAIHDFRHSPSTFVPQQEQYSSTVIHVEVILLF